ncbi:MAG: DUF4345 domain-containing protein [Planctomycetota bacterium]
MSTHLYLAFNALMYAVFAAWCTMAPRQTAEFVGLRTASSGGESEYLAVYGGLQAGLALFFGLASVSESQQRSALWLSVLLYGGISAFRTIAVVRLGFGQLGNARFFYCAEIVLFLIAALLLARRPA